MNAMQQPGDMKALTVRGAHDDLATRLYVPVNKASGGLIVFFPPGGFISDTMDEMDPFLRELAGRTGCRVLASSYTLAHVRPFPAAAEDAHAVLDWVAKHRARLAWSGASLMVAGIEAGGNLAAVAALMARDRGGPPLTAQLLIMPMLDPGLTSCSMRQVSDGNGTAREANACAAGYRGYLPRAIDRTHPYASPLQSSRLKDLPPALILSADDDPLRDEAEQYGAKLIAAGVKTLAKRLSPLALQEPHARCSCARRDEALQEIASFVAGLRPGASSAKQIQGNAG